MVLLKRQCNVTSMATFVFLSRLVAVTYGLVPRLIPMPSTLVGSMGSCPLRKPCTYRRLYAMSATSEPDLPIPPAVGKKKLTLLTFGSRGDVQPFVALGKGLQADGHAVTLATHEKFRPFVESNGLQFATVAMDPEEMLNGDAGQEWLNSGTNPVAQVRAMKKLALPIMESVAHDCVVAAEGADAIIYSSLAGQVGDYIAEKNEVPGVRAYLQPTTRTRRFPSMLVKQSLGRFGPWFNLVTHFALEGAFWFPFRSIFNQLRTDVLGLPKMGLLGAWTRGTNPTVYGYSPTLLPKPDDWDPEQICVSGFWFLDKPSTFTPPADLEEFLSAGPPPVYIGFGSMVDSDPETLNSIVTQALRSTNQRGILMAGWGGVANGGEASSDETVYTIRDQMSIPHDWLFPRCAAVVHHGGAGTTAAGLRAGSPSIIVPYFTDQFLYAKRVEELGAGPKSIPRSDLTSEGLSAAIREAVESSAVKAAAERTGVLLRAETGLDSAVKFINSVI